MSDLKWPGGASCAVSLTFDLDADVGECWRHFSRRLTSKSQAQYGAGRGLQRLIDLLTREKLEATFYVPGEIARMYPEKIRDLHARGHEIGHHGYFHLRSDQVREVEERDEILRGIAALEEATGHRPVAYRSPGWELTPLTLELLIAEGFQYDSSCMGDDRPYMLRFESLSIVELPIHWSLDDWVYFPFTRDEGGIMSNPDALVNTWKREVLCAMQEHRHVTFTMHPEVIGRGYRCHLLSEFVSWMKAQKAIWIANHATVVRHLRSAVGGLEPQLQELSHE
jgi:peptidoglycan-N-acetylglucosamine deacetylase